MRHRRKRSGGHTNSLAIPHGFFRDRIDTPHHAQCLYVFSRRICPGARVPASHRRLKIVRIKPALLCGPFAVHGRPHGQSKNVSMTAYDTNSG